MIPVEHKVHFVGAPGQPIFQQQVHHALLFSLRRRGGHSTVGDSLVKLLRAALRPTIVARYAETRAQALFISEFATRLCFCRRSA